MSKQLSWWMIGHGTAETSLGAGVADGNIDRWYEVEDAILPDRGGEEDTDEEQIKGYDGISEDGDVVLRERVQISVKMRPNVEMLGHCIASQLNQDPVSGTNPNFTHAFKEPPLSLIVPRTFSILAGQVRGDTSTIFKYNGMHIAKWNAQWTVDNPEGELTFDLVGDGSEVATPGFSEPAIGTALKGDRLRYEHFATALLNGVDLLTGGLSGRGRLRSFSFGIDASMQDEPRASAGTKAGVFFYGEGGPKVESQVVLEGQKGDSIWDLHKDRTSFVADFLVELNSNRSIRFQGNATKIPLDAGELTGIEKGMIRTLTLPLRYQYKVADLSKYLVTVKNGIAAYLA